MKVALVHDDFMQWGGAERVVAAMAEIWPDAPIYTIAYDPDVLPEDFNVSRLVPTVMQKPWVRKYLYPKFFFLDPALFERLTFEDYDVVISSSSRFAKSIITHPDTLHIGYINSPPRFLWPVSRYFGPKQYVARFTGKLPFGVRHFANWFLKLMLTLLRIHDVVAAQRFEYRVGNSENVARRIRAIYRRQADVIYPFADIERFAKDDVPDKENFYLVVSRLVSHKRVALAVEACTQGAIPLKVVGRGPELATLRALAGPTVEILGYQDDGMVTDLMLKAKGFIYPQEEDFGITAVEAQAAGTPVVAYAAGGALETVIDGVTGVFFDEQTTESLLAAIHRCDAMSFDHDAMTTNAARFSKPTFKRAIEAYVRKKYTEQPTIDELRAELLKTYLPKSDE